jgi:hypothetical protein
MTACHSEMNRRISGAAADFPDKICTRDAAAFFGSLHGPLSHLLWTDRMWMSCRGGSERPSVGLLRSTLRIAGCAEPARGAIRCRRTDRGFGGADPARLARG